MRRWIVNEKVEGSNVPSRDNIIMFDPAVGRIGLQDEKDASYS